MCLHLLRKLLPSKVIGIFTIGSYLIESSTLSRREGGPLDTSPSLFMMHGLLLSPPLPTPHLLQDKKTSRCPSIGEDSQPPICRSTRATSTCSSLSSQNVIMKFMKSRLPPSPPPTLPRTSLVIDSAPCRTGLDGRPSELSPQC